MTADALIRHRVTDETKNRFSTLARNRKLPESALLKKLIDFALAGAGIGNDEPTEIVNPISMNDRLTVRLPVDDALLLRERARARG